MTEELFLRKAEWMQSNPVWRSQTQRILLIVHSFLEKQQFFTMDREQSIASESGEFVLDGERNLAVTEVDRIEKECYMSMKLVCFSQKSSEKQF